MTKDSIRRNISDAQQPNQNPIFNNINISIGHEDLSSPYFLTISGETESLNYLKINITQTPAVSYTRAVLLISEVFVAMRCCLLGYEAM
jgi:hypothetical protein